MKRNRLITLFIAFCVLPAFADLSDYNFRDFCSPQILSELNEAAVKGDFSGLSETKIRELLGNSPFASDRLQLSLSQQKRAFSRQVHIVIKGLGSEKVVSYIFNKKGQLTQVRFNSSLKKNFDPQNFNAYLKGDRLYDSDQINRALVAANTPEPLDTFEPESRVAAKRKPLKPFFESHKGVEGSWQIRRVGLSRSISENATLNAGAEWNAAPLAEENLGVIASLKIKTDRVFFPFLIFKDKKKKN